MNFEKNKLRIDILDYTILKVENCHFGLCLHLLGDSHIFTLPILNDSLEYHFLNQMFNDKSKLEDQMDFNIIEKNWTLKKVSLIVEKDIEYRFLGIVFDKNYVLIEDSISKDCLYVDNRGNIDYFLSKYNITSLECTKIVEKKLKTIRNGFQKKFKLPNRII